MSVTINHIPAFELGGQLLIARPSDLLTDWSWEIREADNPSAVKDFKTSGLIPNATGHVFAQLDSRYETGVKYELRIFNDSVVLQTSGYFWVERAAFSSGSGSGVDLSAFNAKIRLALGLSGLDSVSEVVARDPVTGIPTQVVVNVYTDNTLTTRFATFVIRRRLNAAKQVVGEVSRRTYYNEDALYPSTGSGSAS